MTSGVYDRQANVFARRRRVEITDFGIELECRQCGEMIPLEGFSRHDQTPTGLRNECRRCSGQKRLVSREQIRAYREAYNVSPHGQNAMRRGRMLQRFGLTEAAVAQMMADQGGRCALWGAADAGMRRFGKDVPLHVDHDHATGAVRGLLCNRCNAALERVEAVPGWEQRARAYLDAGRDYRDA